MIQVEGLTKLYGDFVAVNELSFSVQPGKVILARHGFSYRSKTI